MADQQLFDTGSEPEPPAGRTAVPPQEGPLPVRLRPTTLDDFVGQEHILAPGSVLRRAVEEGRPHSMLLYGPPGSGKTTLARILAAASSGAYEELSAVQVGRAEVRAVIERAQHRRQATGAPTLLFLDEIHRFNKAQQDALLPAVEEGLVTLIGATTENPYFEVNSALLSRLHVYELHALSAEQVGGLLRRAEPSLSDAVVEFLADRSGGDARAALGALELAREVAGPDGEISLELAEDSLQRKAVRYDKDRDQHYDTISAWIKATRGSDVNASLYYLAVMLEGGEDPRFIVRRMVILASEDIGIADPNALPQAVAAAHAVEHVGMPEATFALGQAAIYLSRAPKSDAVRKAIGAARGFVREHGAQLPPDYLRSTAGGAGRLLGRGVGYDSPHNYPDHQSRQELMPPGLEGTRFMPEEE